MSVASLPPPGRGCLATSTVGCHHQSQGGGGSTGGGGGGGGGRRGGGFPFLQNHHHPHHLLQPILLLPAALLQRAALLVLLVLLVAPPPTLPQRQKLTIGILVPDHSFRNRGYRTALFKSLMTYTRDRDFTINENYTLKGEMLYMDEYSPPEILSAMCSKILANRINTIMYLSNSDYMGEFTSSGQYLLQTANFMGIPVIAWNGDNSGFFQVSVLSINKALVFILYFRFLSAIYMP